MIWHAHIPLNEADQRSLQAAPGTRDGGGRWGGPLAKIRGASNCMELLQMINSWVVSVIRVAPDDQVAALDGIRVFLLEQLMGEFAEAIDQAVRTSRQVGTLQRSVAMHPKKGSHRKDR